MALDRDIEMVNLPENGDFKMVQLLIEKRPIMVCGSPDVAHTVLLEEYLNSTNIVYDFISPRGKSIVNPQGERYTVNGMGFGRIYAPRKIFILDSGSSYDYSIGPHPDFTERLKTQLADWRVITT